MNIVIEIKKGNHVIFEQVYHEYHEKLYFFVLKKTNSTDLAQETVQQAFIKLWENKEKLSSDFPIAVQLARITRTTLIDALRKKAVEKKVFHQLTVTQPSFSNEEPILEKELRQKITSITNNLPHVCKRVFKLSREEGLSHKEIAKQLVISPKSVESHITKALKLIRQVTTYILILKLF